jgi:acetate kinase
VVHGGARYTEAVYVDDEVIGAIEQMEELAPLHNAPSVAVMRVVRSEVAERVRRWHGYRYR